MFTRINVVAAVVAVASALSIQTPSNPRSDGSITIRWTPEAGDPNVFSIQLTNEIFHDTYAIANNVPTSQGEITLDLPTLQPGDGYTIIAHDITDINNIIGETSNFSVGSTSATSTTVPSTTSTGTTSTTSATETTESTTTPTTTIPISTPSFGTTVQNSATTSSSTATSAGAQATEENSALSVGEVKGMSAVMMMMGGVVVALFAL